MIFLQFWGSDMRLRTDIETLNDGDTVILHPRKNNPLHTRKVKAYYCHGYFYCDSSSPHGEPDYNAEDVLDYNHGWEIDKGFQFCGSQHTKGRGNPRWRR